MDKSSCVKNLSEMERLREELYRLFDGKWSILHTEEIYDISRRLDKLIVAYMCRKYHDKAPREK